MMTLTARLAAGIVIEPARRWSRAEDSGNDATGAGRNCRPRRRAELRRLRRDDPLGARRRRRRRRGRRRRRARRRRRERRRPRRPALPRRPPTPTRSCAAPAPHVRSSSAAARHRGRRRPHGARRRQGARRRRRRLAHRRPLSTRPTRRWKPRRRTRASRVLAAVTEGMLDLGPTGSTGSAAVVDARAEHGARRAGARRRGRRPRRTRTRRIEHLERQVSAAARSRTTSTSPSAGAAVVKLRATGLSIAAIATRLGLAVSTVARDLRQTRTPRRPYVVGLDGKRQPSRKNGNRPRRNVVAMTILRQHSPDRRRRPPPPPPPKLVASDRRPDPRALGARDPAVARGRARRRRRARRATVTTFERWEAGDETRSATCAGGTPQAVEHDREAEQSTRPARPASCPSRRRRRSRLELTGAMRAVEVLERELVATGKRLFAASLEYVPAARGGARARGSTTTTTASPSCSTRRSPCSTSARSRAPRRGWLVPGEVGDRGRAVPAARGPRQPDRRRAARGRADARARPRRGASASGSRTRSKTKCTSRRRACRGRRRAGRGRSSAPRPSSVCACGRARGGGVSGHEGAYRFQAAEPETLEALTASSGAAVAPARRPRTSAPSRRPRAKARRKVHARSASRTRPSGPKSSCARRSRTSTRTAPREADVDDPLRAIAQAQAAARRRRRRSR